MSIQLPLGKQAQAITLSTLLGTGIGGFSVATLKPAAGDAGDLTRLEKKIDRLDEDIRTLISKQSVLEERVKLRFESFKEELTMLRTNWTK